MTVNHYVAGSSPASGVMRFKALVFVRLRGSVSDAAGNAVMNNVKMVAPKLTPHLLRIGKAIDFWFDAETEETGIGNISNDNAGTSKHSLFGD